MARIRVYIKPFTPAGAYASSWTEVTRDVVADSIGQIQRKLDVNEFDVGVYTNSAISFSLRNDQGLYSDVGTIYSIFSYKRADSLVKITWDQADWDFFAGTSQVGEIQGGEVIVYQGLLSDESTVMGLTDQQVSFDVLGFEAVFNRVLAPNWVSSPPADKKASTLLKAAIAAGNAGITQPVLTIDNTQIVPGNDVSWDDLSVFANKTCKEVIDTVLLASNSVLYLGGASGTTPIVSGRVASVSVLYSFYGPGSSAGPENIVDVQDITTGINRTFNFLTWKATALSSQDATSLSTYGVRKKEISIDGITTGATQQSVIDSIRTEFANPKQEFKLVTPIGYGSLGLALLSRIAIDFPQVPVDASGASLYGVAQYGTDVYGAVLSSFLIQTSEPYKVIGSDVDLTGAKITFYLRRI